ncbi:MAG: diacylglycerol kinase family protein [Reyranellaceae bacterium]
MLIVLNPTAGRRNRQLLAATLAALETQGVKADLRETQAPGHATELARAAARAGQSPVIAAGGDGTVAEVVNGLMAEAASAPALGILPLGTANVLAHELAIPTAPAALAELLARRRRRAIWPGVLEQAGRRRWFVQMVGAGFDAEVVHRVDPRLKRRAGAAAYAWQGLVEASRYAYPRIDLAIDGVPTTTHGVIVSKGRLYAGRYTLADEASPLDRGYKVVLLDRPGALRTLAGGVALPFGRMARLPGVRIVAARQVEILGGSAPLQADGDPSGSGACSVRRPSRPLDVLMP